MQSLFSYHGHSVDGMDPSKNSRKIPLYMSEFEVHFVIIRYTHETALLRHCISSALGKRRL